MAIRVLHTGDLHIGSFPGPEKNGENLRFLDICKCLDALVAGAKEQKPGVAVIAGDIFHQARVWSDRGLKEQQTTVKFLRELSTVCPVVVMRGTPNHDSEQQFEMLKTAFDGDGNVKIITEPQVVEVYSGAYGWVQVACVPGFDRGYYRAKHPGLSKEEENEVFTKAIAELIIGLKAQCRSDAPAILVSHYTITGCNMESGQTAFFSQFEPVVYPDTLTAAGFDLTCFGHIHRPQRLEGCPNTFYCGAISALNFNDEGQERGYWLHDIDNAGVVTSTFQKLPTRQYKTLRLNDEDVAGITTGGKEVADFLDRADDIEGKIVRVLYDCTDEHNKAFNHAVFENMLYAAGAFWVQEITPQKITITVDKRSMEAESTPEENLADYLLEKGYDADQAGGLVELARPIIAEAAEKATQERHTGLLVPVEIEVKNYRNYRNECFSFDGIKFCTINGSNGVGKSSLFMDAMLDALYEEPREGDLTGWICNDPEARSGAIKLTFKLGDRLYRVTRTRQKSGKATLNISEFCDGEWADRSKEKIRDTQQEIINIIGMDSLTLKACALIMQDQYGLFLQADKEARMTILGNILGLGIYGDMEELAASNATETNRAIRSLADRADGITADLPNRTDLEAQIREAENTRQQAEDAAKSKAAQVDGLKVALNTQLEAAGRVVKLNDKISTLTAQKAAKESTKTVQVGIITAADTVLASEVEILSGVAQYNALLEQEKELIKGKAAYDGLLAQRQKILEDVQAAEETAKNAKLRKVELTVARVEPLKKALDRETELTATHTEYEQSQARLAELETLAPDYEARKAEVTRWKDEMQRLESDYLQTRTPLLGQIDTLKKKVELLNNSGCPDIEKATCKFLADAQEAKERLPAVETTLANLEEEYDNGRRRVTEAFYAAEEALKGCLYQPEEIDGLRAIVRRLEGAEKEYRNLAAQKSELVLVNDRVGELEKRIEESEATAEKGRTELAAIDQQISEIAGANEEYGKLQAEIAVTRQWVDREKQLPVAQEQKNVAAQRLLELTTEIENIEKEVSERRDELAAEQGKMAGTEELRAQVNAAEAEINSLRDTAQAMSVKLGGLRELVEQVEKKLAEAAEMQAQMNDLSGRAAGYEELKRAFSQDGIPHNIIRSIIPVFEATATNILGQMSQGRMSVEFVTEKVLKSNSKKEVTTLDIIINDSGTGRLPYMSRSGGERVKAALSVILALSEIKSSKAGVQLGFLFIDEAPFLDTEGTQAYCDALEAIQHRYPNTKVMAITHDETFKARFPQSVTVYKDESGSHVRGD